MRYPKELYLADISESAKKLYKIMRGLSGEGKNPRCFAKVMTLASKLGKSARYTRELLRQLEEGGLIEGQFRRRAPTIYLFPKSSAEAPHKFPISSVHTNTKGIRQEDKELFNISFYKDTLKTLSHSSETRARLLFLLSKREEEICPRTFLEGLIDGLGFSKDYVQEKIGTKDWKQIDEFRNKLITGYRLLDREKAGNFIQTLYPISHGRYIYYPYMMIELMEHGLCPGFDLSYLKAKTRMIKTLSKGLDTSKMGGDLKEVHAILGTLTESYDYSDEDLKEKNSSGHITIN